MLNGEAVQMGNPGEAIRNGFALIPEDRRKKGLVLIHSVKENAILPKVAKMRKNGIFVDEKAAVDMVNDNVQKLFLCNQFVLMLIEANQKEALWFEYDWQSAIANRANSFPLHSNKAEELFSAAYAF